MWTRFDSNMLMKEDNTITVILVLGNFSKKFDRERETTLRLRHIGRAAADRDAEAMRRVSRLGRSRTRGALIGRY